MTLVIYEPAGPALEFIGHAGAGLCGQDPVCAALSILMYTLIEAVPAAAVSFGDGYCRIDAGRNPANEQSGGFLRGESSVKQNVSTESGRGAGFDPTSAGADRAARIPSEPHGSGTERASAGPRTKPGGSGEGESPRSGKRSAPGGFVREKEKGGSGGGAFVTLHGSGTERASAGPPAKPGRNGFAGEKEEGGSGGGAFVTLHGSGTERASFDVILCGLRLLADSFPHHVRLEVKK